MPGAMVFSNVNASPLADERFWPLWKKADELGAVIYIHPTHPAGVEAMLDYWLMPLVGFLFDTTLAASKLVFSGVVERHPNIRWVLTHMGGAIPYLAERLDRGYRAFDDCRAHIEPAAERNAAAVLLRHRQLQPSRRMRLALEFAGADHLLAGSDYPHQIGSIPLMLESIERFDVDLRVKQKILRSERGAAPRPVADYRLLRRDRRAAAAQHELLDLAGRRLRQLRHEGEAVRALEVREPIARERAQLLRRRRAVRLQDDEGVRRFTPFARPAARRPPLPAPPGGAAARLRPRPTRCSRRR